jgi:O-antigen/teichoic acid export membrane protein
MGPLLYGALQGLQAFGVLSILGQAQALLRLGLGVACVLWIRAGADLALAGHLVAVSLILFAGMGWLRRRLNRPAFSERTDRTPPAGWGYAVRSLIVLAAAGILMNADVVLAKRYLDPSVAGVFARAATVARAIVFLPAPIALALFPRVASSGMLRAGDRRLLQHAVGLVTLLILAAVGVATWALPWIYPLLTGGESDASTLFLARSLLWALSPIGIVILLLNFAMAQHRFSACYPVCAGAAGYLGAVALWHRTPGDIVRALAGFGFLSLLVLVIRLRRVLWQKDGSEFAGRVIESAGNGK